MFEIEIVYGLAGRQELHIMQVEEGTAVRQAALHSSIVERFPNVDLNTAPLGIFGRVVKDDTILRTHDRIEAYRPLFIDPKDVRREHIQNKEEGRQAV